MHGLDELTNVKSKCPSPTESIKVSNGIEWCPSRLSEMTLGNTHGFVIVMNATLNLFSLDTDPRMGMHARA